jgi:hypothetical protein
MNKLMRMAVAAMAIMATCASVAKSYDDDDDYYGDYLTFSMDTDEFPEYIGDAEVLFEYLPDAIDVEWTGKKLKTPKSAAPKVKKIDGEYEIVVSEKGEDNPCGLKLSYKKKSGKVSGSFKVYAAYETKKGKLKLKKYSAKVSGYIGEDSLTVTIKKIGTFGASLE